jgi:demethylmenaquinone methyltransferase/2-methoxy-6-polyprenyl-1,4-benzoquinol methylase
MQVQKTPEPFGPELPEPDRRADHGRAVARMFGRIAGWYDFLNHFLSLGQDVYWRFRLVRFIRLDDGKGQADPAPLVLDLAAGTLDVSLAILKRFTTARVLALDFSLPMLLHGRRKIKAADAGRIACVLADGRTLPLPGESVSAATIAFGIRNIVPRSEAHAEILRVLKPGGRYLILEFGSGRERIWRGVYNFYLNRVLPLIGRIVSKDQGAYAYLAETIAAFPAAPDLARELLDAGFARVYYQPLLSGIVYIHVAEKGRREPAPA